MMRSKRDLNVFREPCSVFGSRFTVHALHLFIFILLPLLLAGCGSLANGRDRRSADLPEPTPIPTAPAAARTTYEVARGDVVYTVNFAGRVAPVVEQALAFTLDGTVGQVHVQRGQAVQTGDLIAELDTTGLLAELTLAQAALDVAQAQQDAAVRESTLARQRAEMRRDLAQLDLDFALAQAGDRPTAVQQYEIDRLTLLRDLAQLDVDELATAVPPQLAADLDLAALRIAELEAALAQTTLTAPFDGIITALNLAPGRSVTAAAAVGAVADPAQIEVAATSLRDGELAALAEEMAAQITPSGGPGATLSGSIRRLPYPYGGGGETAVTDADTSVRIQFNDPAAARGEYEPGDRVTISVVVTEHRDVLWLPPAAIRDFNGRKFVVVQNGDAQQRIDVTLGIEGNGRVEIVDGLTAGQVVVGQ